MPTRLDFSRYGDIDDREVLVPLTYRQKIICASALQMLTYDATWSYYNDGSSKKTVQDDVTNILYRFMCDEQDTEIVQNILEELENLKQTLSEILEEVMGDVIVTQNVYGCGCKDENNNGGANGGNDTPADDNTTPQTPPETTDEQTPNNETYNQWLCDASHQASKNLTQFMINFKNQWDRQTDGVLFATGLLASIPFMSAYSQPLIGFINSVLAFGELYPFDDYISWLQSTENDRACILYMSNTTREAETATVNFVYEGLNQAYDYQTYILFRPILSLLDYNKVYEQNSYNVTTGNDCSSCGNRDENTDQNGTNDIVDWSGLGYCLTSVSSITPSANGATVAESGDSLFWSFPHNQNIIGTIGFGKQIPEGATVHGFAFRVKNIDLYNGSYAPSVGGVSQYGQMTNIMVQSREGIFVVANEQLESDLQNKPVTILQNFNETAPIIAIQSEFQTRIGVSEFYWIHDCVVEDGSFYLLILSDYSIEPDNWLVSGSSGNVFTIKNGYFNTGTTNEVFSHVDNGIFINKRGLQFFDWVTDGTKNIRIKIMRLSGSIQGSSESVDITLNGALSTIQNSVPMANEDEEHIFETSTPPPADTYRIDFNDSLGGDMRSILVYGCEEF